MDSNDDFKTFLVFLSQFDYTYSKNNAIIESMDGDFSLKHFLKKKFPENLLSQENFEKMKEKADILRIKNYYKNMQDQDIVLVTKFDDNYPAKLKDLPDSPTFLFCRGDLSLFNRASLAVVGSRKPSAYG